VTALAELTPPITTTFQLMGKFLALKEHGVGSIEHADRFYYWLKDSKTAAGQRAGVVRAIAEKLNILNPGLYDRNLYEDLVADVAADANDAAVAVDAVDAAVAK